MLTKGFDEVSAGCVQISGDGMATSLSVWIDSGLGMGGEEEEGKRRGGQGRASKREGPEISQVAWSQSQKLFFLGRTHCVHCEWSMSLGITVGG